MKLKNILIPFAGVLLLTACEKDHRNDNLVDPRVYIVNNGVQTATYYDVEETLDYDIYAYSSGYFGQPSEVKVVLDPDAVETFNAANGSSYTLLGEEYYQIVKSTGSISAEGRRATLTVRLDCKEIMALPYMNDYVLPLRLTAAGTEVNEELNTILINPRMQETEVLAENAGVVESDLSAADANTLEFTAYTEFGIPGISPREVLEGIIPAEELFPPRPGTAWEEHHAFGAWDGDPSTWLGLPTLARYFPPAETLDELIAQSSLLQGEGYKAVFEEARRQKPYCSMALNWCFDEPWPAAANNSLVAYPAVLKPAIAEVRRACRPLCASARFARFDWKEGETFEAEVWILNDVFARTGPFVVTVTLRAGRAEERILRWESPSVEPNRNTAGPTARFRLPAWDTDRFGVELSVEGHPEMNACYTLMYRRSPRKRRCTSMNVTE